MAREGVPPIVIQRQLGQSNLGINSIYLQGIDPIGSGPPAITARVLAFCLVIAGAALMPAPMRATPDAG
jgi:hypothetical protein